MRNSSGIVLSFLLAVAADSIAQAAAADSMPSHLYSIPAGDLLTAIESIQRQSDVQIVYQPEKLKGIKTPGLNGTLTSQEAVRTLLEGTKLRLSTDARTGAMLIVSRDAKTSSTSLPTGGAVLGLSNSLSEERDRLSPAQEKVAERATELGPRPHSTSDGRENDKAAGIGEEAAKMPEVLVKGAKAMNVDVVRTANDVQPYTIFTSEQIQKSGAVDLESFLKQQLTMNTSSQSYGQGLISPAGTTSSINLRGLGAGETLVLIDGRRSASVALDQLSFGPSQPDINGIPMTAVERIEVLPSSASAIYGGAAMGGVVNIILKRNFEGGEVGVSYENPTSGDAPIKSVNASVGTSLAATGTQLFLSGHYTDAAPLLLKDRQSLIDRGISEILSNAPAQIYGSSAAPFFGSTTNISSAPQFLVVPSGTAGATCFGTFCYTMQAPNLSLKDGTLLNSPITFVPPGAQLSSPSAGLVANAGKYNLALSPGNGPLGLQGALGQAPVTKSLYATVRQPVGEATLFAEYSLTGNSSDTTANPFPGQQYAISASSPVNPFQQDVNITFPSDVRSRQENNSVTRSATLGVIAQLPLEWRSELDYTWSESAFSYAIGFADSIGLQADIDSGALNPFVDTIKNGLNLSPYLGLSSYNGSSTLNDVALRASGSVGRLPGGKPTISIGIEHRKEGTEDSPYEAAYPIAQSSDIRSVYFGRSQSTDSVYLEALAPLISRRNYIPLVRSLDVQIAARSERYTVYNGTAYVFLNPDGTVQDGSPPQGIHNTLTYTSTNPTIGFKYEPADGIAVRASYATAFLPPTAAQLLPNPTLSFYTIDVADPQSGQTYGVHVVSGGNPQLQPQTSKAETVGIVWEPKSGPFSGFRGDLEYYEIAQPNYITVPAAQQVLDTPSFASRVRRDSSTGLITSVDTSYVNASKYKTSGWDGVLDYRFETFMGAWDLHASGTYIRHDLRQYALGSPFLEYAGFPNDGGEGKIKGNATISWSAGAWSALWTTIYYSGYYQQFSPQSPSAIQQPNLDYFVIAEQGSSSIPSQVYHNLYVSYSLYGKGDSQRAADRWLSKLTIEAGIQNVFNRAPPFDAFNNRYFYSFLGDPRLRTFRLGIKASL